MTATWNNTRSWNFETAEAKAAREAAEHAAFVAKMEIARQQQRAARIKRELPIYTAITNALQRLTKVGEVVLDAETLKITVKGIDVSYNFHVDEERSQQGYYRGGHKTGKLRISVGDFGERKSYPQRKDGTHDYVAIAEKLLQHAEKRLASIRAEAARKANADVIPALRQEYGFKYEYSGQGVADVQVAASSNVDRPVLLTFKYNGTATVERAREIMDALKALKLMD